MTRSRIEYIFAEAIKLPPDERARRLDAACGDDDALRAEVESLIEAHEDVGEFMGDPSTPPDSYTAGELDPVEGAAIGRYKILERIGEGGFGSVFMAEQLRPVRRCVALKLIKLGMDTRQVIARFEAERQALAMMDHPNIARVHDGGVTETGRPYFVMEMVRGEPITAYCDANRLSIRDRLDLFRQVCSAVQHAHQKGILHRDIKPSNILISEIDGQPTPKIIDFGIAKAISGEAQLTEKTLVTEFRQFMGTPEYMSPEQAGLGAVDIDTRSDIYSLGVLLYHLLTGGSPLDPKRMRSLAWEEMRRIVREDDPERPSTRLHACENAQQIAADRRTEPGRLVGLVRGDLDWIVMKCLEKDRARRYETASGLSMDIGRYLAGEPVLAAPPSRVYRVRKFVRRHRGPATAGLAVAFIFVAALIVVSVQSARIRAEASRVTEISQFLETLLISADPFPWNPDEMPRHFGASARYVDVLDDAVRRLDEHPLHNREAEATIRYRMGLSYFGMGMFAEGAHNLEWALKVRREKYGEDDLRTLACKRGLAFNEIYLFDNLKALRLARQAVDGCLATVGRYHDETLKAYWVLLVACIYAGRQDDQFLVAREMLEIIETAPQRVTFPAAAAKVMLASGYSAAGAHVRGEELAQQALAELEAVAPRTFTVGYAHQIVSQSATAHGEWDRAVVESRAYVKNASLVYTGGALGEVETALASALCQHPDPAMKEEGVALLREIIASCRGIAHEDRPITAQLLQRCAGTLSAIGLQEEAIPLYELWDEMRTRGNHAPTQRDLWPFRGWASALRAQGKLSEAEAVYQKGLDYLRQFSDEEWRANRQDYGWLLFDFCEMLNEQGHDDDLRLYETELRERAMVTPDLANALAWRYWQAGKLTEAEPLARAAVEGLRSSPLDYPTDRLIYALDTRAVILRDLGRLEEAEALFREVVASWARVYRKSKPVDAEFALRYGECLLRMNRFAEAEPLLLAAASSTPSNDTDAGKGAISATHRLAELYEAWHAAEPGGGHDAQAQRWRDRLESAASGESGR